MRSRAIEYYRTTKNDNGYSWNGSSGGDGGGNVGDNSCDVSNRQCSHQWKSRLSYYKQLVQNAIVQRKTYRIVSKSTCNKLKAELINRGYVEHVEIKQDNVYYKMSVGALLDMARHGNDCENALIAKLLGDRPPDFVWITGAQMKYFAYPKAIQLNRIRFTGTNFTLKHGLVEYVRKINNQMMMMTSPLSPTPTPEPTTTGSVSTNGLNDEVDYWLGNLNRNSSGNGGIGSSSWDTVSDSVNNDSGNVALIPRMYELTDDADLADFHKDFYWSTAVGIVMFLNDQAASMETWFNMRHHSLEVDGILLALRVISHAVARIENDWGLCCGEIDDSYMHERFWPTICRAHEALTKLRCRIRTKNITMTHQICNEVRRLAPKILRYWPQHQYDGYRNVWIVKPAASGRGDSILVSNDMQKIMRHLDYDYRRYIVQRYIERPLLMHRTKFDLRHYFLITIDARNKFCGWTHREACDVKICSTPFTLDNFSECSHVTNTAVQSRYQNTSRLLPDNHMMSLQRLNEYFEMIGHPNAYYNRVLPLIKQTLHQICEQAVNDIELSPGRYELFGCDWIIDESFTPYLLEINRAPGLAYYTPVSVIANSQLMEDLVKGNELRE